MIPQGFEVVCFRDGRIALENAPDTGHSIVKTWCATYKQAEAERDRLQTKYEAYTEIR